jgi:hypothetical protein
MSMANAEKVGELVDRYLAARVPLIVIRTIEPSRALDIINGCASRKPSMSYYEYSRTEGMRELLSGQPVADEPSLAVALDYARTTFRARMNVNFIFSDVDDLEDEGAQSRHFAEMVRLAVVHQGAIILISSKPIWSGLGRLGMSVTLDLPTTDELALILGLMVDDHRSVIDVQWQYDDVRLASEILAGVTQMEAENILASLLAKGSLRPEDLPELSEFKDRIFGDLAGIERVALKEGYQVGGLTNLRSWLAKRYVLMTADLSNTQLKPPKGVLLVGVPGCGKSLSAKAIAAEWNLPLYRLDMSAVFGQYLGQSEGRFREALDTADRVAPCVLWIDEIEKGFSAGGDGGTAQRMIGQFLFWLQESTSKVFIVATANEVHTLPPELLRKGRFDELFFVDLPDEQDRDEIIRLYALRYLQYDLPPDISADLVKLTEGFSGSDIDAAIHELASTRFANGQSGTPPDDDIRAYIQNVVPFSQTNPEEVAAIRSWGMGRCVPAGVSRQSEPTATSRRMVLS